jgi:uncharacterized protein
MQMQPFHVAMSVFTLEGKKTVDFPTNCRDLIKQYKGEGMFDIGTIIDGKQEYTTIYFLMTQDCDLNCQFCYQPKEFRQKNTNISQKIIDDTMNFVFRTFDETRIKVSLFGGEPFLNFEMIKYLVEKYPMIRFLATTNGYALLEHPEYIEWIRNHKHNLKVSVSITALKQKLGSTYLQQAKDILDLVNYNNGDVHYVIADPAPETYDEIISLFEYPVSMVRISSARHWDAIRERNDEFITLFKRLADYLYFSGEPKFGRCQWDMAFRHNIYKKNKQLPIKNVPPTFCGCGYLYVAVNNKGDLYPCDFFANFPELKMGDIYTGFNENAIFFKKMGEWIEGLYEDCRDCQVCENKDIRLCPRAMCLAENYLVTGNPLSPAPNHCWANRIEYQLFDYLTKKAIELGIDKEYGKTDI